MKMTLVTAVLAATAVMALAAPKVKAQSRPYMGYVYPAGGQQGATFAVKIGGQSLDNVTGVIVTGGSIRIFFFKTFSSFCLCSKSFTVHYTLGHVLLRV